MILPVPLRLLPINTLVVQLCEARLKVPDLILDMMARDAARRRQLLDFGDWPLDLGRMRDPPLVRNASLSGTILELAHVIRRPVRSRDPCRIGELVPRERPWL